MYFAKDEIIELNDGRKYLVLDTVALEEKIYYKVVQLDNEETKKQEEPIYITADNREGKIYINENLTIEELTKIEELFKD